MPGLFDNENRRYVNLPEIEQGDWYLDQDRQLYIVPLDGDTHGPDNKTMDAIEEAYRMRGTLSDRNRVKLGLQRVLPILKRFCPNRGWYVA